MKSKAIDLNALREVTKAIGQATDPNMPWHRGLVLLTVALYDKEGIDSRELARLCGLTPALVSRNLGELGEWSRLQRPGLGLVETSTDYADRRRKPVKLTAKGRKLMDKILGR